MAVAVTSAFAAALGYFIFYGRVSDVYLGVITLTVTLIFFSLIRRTSGPEYKIGKALLGGFNGVSSPPINLPWNPTSFLFPEQVFYVAMAALILCYVFVCLLVNTKLGRLYKTSRRDDLPAESLVNDIGAHTVGTFTIGAGVVASWGILL